MELKFSAPARIELAPANSKVSRHYLSRICGFPFAAPGALPRNANCTRIPSGVILVPWRRAKCGFRAERCAFHQRLSHFALDLPPSETSRWRAVVRVLRSPVDALSCALLPDDCTLCGSSLPRISPVPICDFCWAACCALKTPVCARCGDSLDANAPAEEDATALCRACRLAPPPFVRAVAFGLYAGRMKAAIHALKYDRLQPAARELGRMLAAAIAQLAPDAPAEMLVIPIPLHRSKLAERGFNQARSLARHAIGFLARSQPQWRLTLAESTLMRLRATGSQAGLSPRQRRLNVRGAFSVSNAAAVRDRHILLIDDIMTTGATARAASLALLRIGAASVRVATLARAHRSFASGNSFFALERQPLDQPGDPPAAVLPQAIMNSSVRQPSSSRG